MVLFDQNHKIKRYGSTSEIIEEFYPIRLQVYQERKDYSVKIIKSDLKIITQKFKFIKGVSTGDINFKDMNKTEMAQTLKAKGFEPSSEDGDFDYLLRMPLWFLCKDKMNELETQMTQKQEQLQKLLATTIEQMWIGELDQLAEAYKKDLKTNFSFSLDSN